MATKRRCARKKARRIRVAPAALVRTKAHPKEHIVPILQAFDPALTETQRRRLTSWPRMLWEIALRCLPARLTNLHRTALGGDDPAWLLRRRANYRHCRLYQLPDEVLLFIRDHTDKITRCVMRQTCFAFLRIVADGDFGVTGNDRKIATVFDGRVVWPLHEAGHTRWHRTRIKRLLARDANNGLCRKCVAFRATAQFDAVVENFEKSDLFCTRCGYSHSCFLFSARQRRAPDADCICISNEGRIVLCAHEALSWSSMLAEWYKQCWPPGRYDFSFPKLGCTHPAHEGDGVLLHGFYVRHPATGSVSRMEIEWAVPAFDLDATLPITRAQLRRFLAAQATTDFGRAFCPHVRPDDGQLMLPFEPDQCACFPDTPLTGYAFGEQHRHESAEAPCCRCYTAANTTLGERFLGKAKHQFRFLGRDRHMHAFKCHGCDARYVWVRGLGRRVFLCCRRRINVHSDRGAKRWLNELSPDSWGASRDRVLHRVTWCKTPGCQTQARWTSLPGVIKPPRSS